MKGSSSKALLRLAIAALALASTLTFTGCVTSRVEVSKEAPARAQQWAQLCRDSALVSALVYRQDHHAMAPSEEPLAGFEQRLQQEGWRHIGTCDRTKGDGLGLCFEVWENRRTSPRQIVIAFRGTSSFGDWSSNLRWFQIGQKRRDHYVLAREECLPLIEKLYAAGPGPRPIISTTGHSLGGGLAQQVLYAAADKVDHAVVFDPSPVTGFYDLNEPSRLRYKSLLNRREFSQYRIIRAYEKGEVLMFARNAMTPIYKPDSLTRSIEFNSHQRAGPVGKHSMNILAKEILEIADRELPPLPAIPRDESVLKDPAYQDEPLSVKVAKVLHQ